MLAATTCARANVDSRPLTDNSPSSVAPASPTPTAEISDRQFPLGTLVIQTSGASVRLDVEIAETAEARARGLMEVERLDKVDGMVFVFEAVSRGGFWMKNTLIPLDIAFWNDEMKIVDILQMEPCKEDPCQVYTPKASYIGAVEVDKGRLGKSGVEVGNEVELVRSE
jgi:uncharacterized membrane protein (UPF0127 family)